MAKVPKFGNVVLCEHVVAGLGNKYTLINAFSGDVIVSELPARLYFGLYAEYFPTESVATDFILEIRLDSKPIGRINIAYTEEYIPGRISVVAVPMFELGVDTDLVLSIVALVGAHKPHELLSKRVYLGKVSAPTA